MISRRLKWAVAAQLVATVGLVSPSMAHWNPAPCPEPPAESLRVCDEDCYRINFAPGEWTAHVDAYVCTLGGQPIHWTAFHDDTDDEGIDEMCDDMLAECEAWTQEGS